MSGYVKQCSYVNVFVYTICDPLWEKVPGYFTWSHDYIKGSLFDYIVKLNL